MPRESTIQVYRSSVTDIATGLTFGELAYTDVNGKLFVGRTGGAALWVGAGITTGDITNNSSVLIPTQSAVKAYVDGTVGGGSVVNTINGTGGAITITGDGGSQLVITSGKTVTFSNRLASASATGVASFGNEFVVSAVGAVGLTSNYVKTFNGLTGAVSFAVPLASATVTGVASFGNEFVVTSGAVGLTSNYVKSVNGSTGAITNVATTNTANVFTAIQSFAGGFTSAGITAYQSINTSGNFIFLRSNPDPFDSVYTIQPSFASSPGSVTLTLPNKTGVVALDSEVVTSINSLTGAITNVARTNAAQSFTGVQTFSNGISVAQGATFNSIASNGIATFTGLATANGGITASHLYVTNGATFASRIQGVGATFTGTVEVDTGLILPNGQTITSAVTTFNGASGAVTFAVPLASATVTGVASFGNEFVVSAVGAVGLTSNYVKTFNGSTGAVSLTGAGAILYTQSGTSNTINARLATTSLTGVASFNSASFDVSAGGDVTIKSAGVSNGQLANSSVTVAAGGNTTLSLGGTITLTGGATPNIIFSSSGNVVTASLANDVTIAGNLTVNGTVVTTNVDNFIVEDPLIALGTGNAADSVDLGWFGHYTSGSLRYAGSFRDASDGKFKFFTGLTAQPTTTIDTAAATYVTATIVANIDGGTF